MPDVHSSEEPPAPEQPPDLRGVSPLQVARFIRGLDGRLLDMHGHPGSGGQALVYLFDIAGKEQSFRAVADGGSIESIADIFPEAAELERRLQREFEITFRRPADV